MAAFVGGNTNWRGGTHVSSPAFDPKASLCVQKGGYGAVVVPCLLFCPDGHVWRRKSSLWHFRMVCVLEVGGAPRFRRTAVSDLNTNRALFFPPRSNSDYGTGRSFSSFFSIVRRVSSLPFPLVLHGVIYKQPSQYVTQRTAAHVTGTEKS